MYTRCQKNALHGTNNAMLTSKSMPVTSHITHTTPSFSFKDLALECLMDIDLFLGGSCNPTTWRHDVAIPMLDAAHVQYFNPQVDEWYEELIQIETKAKERAHMMLVVIDKVTRCLVSINEAVEYICRGKKVVLVVEDIEEGDEIAGNLVSKTELADLNGARQCLRDLATKRNVSVLPDVATAIDECIAWLIQSNASMSRPEIPRFWKSSSIMLNKGYSKHRPRRVTSRLYPSQLLKLNSTDSSKSITDNSEPSSDSPGGLTLSPAQSRMKQLDCQLASNFTGGSVYLGGNLSATSWRQSVAIPLLRKAGIPVYVPFADYLQVGLSPAAEKHVQAPNEHIQAIDTQKTIAELILFVIPRNLRSIAAMTEAVELVSTRQALLLVIESVEEGCMVEKGIPITGCEFKDLARARTYLREMAERNDIAVFESVTEAVESIVERFDEVASLQQTSIVI
ncbi:unnamed protein product [Peronospora belbahrii]|uniref:Uncharacterized protein n=1 Tax=Peronospora belbahrii TaxID=622444 RepID=A0AAU9KV07_9STRA|nr:unnamed protein product [Peronospora belbahrii]CAH0516222.1 unnamed protein product [Peronospora belbahrii]